MSKALEKLLKEYSGWSVEVEDAIRAAHAIGLRDGKRSRGKVVARGWMFPHQLQQPDHYIAYTIDRQKWDTHQVKVEVRRAKA